MKLSINIADNCANLSQLKVGQGFLTLPGHEVYVVSNDCENFDGLGDNLINCYNLEDYKSTLLDRDEKVLKVDIDILVREYSRR